MKIKHWQGYGIVNAKKLSQTKNTLVIKVYGNHEYGIERDDKYDVFEWLVKKFDKNRKDYIEIKNIELDSYNEKIDGISTEVCVYTIYFKN